MRKGFLGSLAVLAAGAGLTFGQSVNPPGPGGPLPGTVPPPGQTMGNPPPGVAPYAYSGPSGANAGYQYAFPDGHPAIMPPGLEGMIPPGSMGAGAPGGVYDQFGGGGGGQGGYGSGGGLLGGLGGKHGRHFWASGEYLLWVPKSLSVNYPLATTSAPADLGLLGGATTASLLGVDQDIEFDPANGFRATVGMTFDESGFGGEASAFWLAKRRERIEYPGNSAGVPVLAVPFFDVAAGAQGAYIVSFPGINSGNLLIDTDVRVIGGELNAVYNMSAFGDQPGGVTFLAGVRGWQLRENFAFVTRSATFGVPPEGVVPPGILPPPAGGGAFFPGAGGFFAGTFFGPALAPYQVLTADFIQTRNDFIGGQVGFRGDIGYGNWFVNLTGKFAAGWMRQRVDILGYSQLTTGTGLLNTVPGGLFNIPQELGRHRKDKFAVLPEGGISLGYQCFSWLRFTAGYTFMWTNSVIRPTSSLTPFVNPNLVPVSPLYTGAAPSAFVPRNVTNDTDFYLHGFNAGVEIRF